MAWLLRLNSTPAWLLPLLAKTNGRGNSSQLQSKSSPRQRGRGSPGCFPPSRYLHDADASFIYWCNDHCRVRRPVVEAATAAGRRMIYVSLKALLYRNKSKEKTRNLGMVIFVDVECDSCLSLLSVTESHKASLCFG